MVSVSVDPSRELDPANLITLCHSYTYGVNCHLFFGHLGDWSKNNPSVREHAAATLALLTMRAL